MPANPIRGLPVTAKEEMVSLAIRLVDELPNGSFDAVPVDDYCERWSDDHNIAIEAIHAELRKMMALILHLRSNPEALRQATQEAGIE